MRRYRCGLGPSLRAVAAYCAIVEDTVNLSPYLAKAFLPSSL